MASEIRTFTKSGKALNVTPTGIKPAHLGTRTADGLVWQYPRLKLDTLSGPRVKVTNPAASLPAGRNKRTAGLGMGAANTAMQRGRTRDF
jgi:hypothetical protein